MRPKIASAAGLAAAAAIGALAATSLAGEDGGQATILRDENIREVAAEPLTPAGTTRVPLRAGGRPAQALSYIQTDPIVIPPKTEEAVEVNKCPKGSKAVTGYFETGNPGTFLDLSRPIPDSPRRWRIGAYNDTPNADEAIFGIVCLSQVK
jgi:hypothetical protein